MGGSRSWLLGGILCSPLCSPVVAQPGHLVTCVAAASPIPVYASGITEPLSDILVRCSAADSSPVAARSDLRLEISVSLNTTVTNSTREAAGGWVTDAVLVVNGNDCAMPSASGSSFGSCGAPSATTQDPQYGLFTGDGSLQWSNVSVPFPGGMRADGSGRTNAAVSALRIRGIRGNASQLNLGSEIGPAGPPLVASLKVRSDSPVALRNGTLSLGYPAAALHFGKRGEESISACQGDARARATVRVREGFPSAFRTRTSEPTATPSTRILLEFSDVSEGNSLRLPAAVQCRGPDFDAGQTGPAGALALGLVSGHGPDGVGGSVVSTGGATARSVEVDLLDGVGRAVYEVTEHDPSQLEECHVSMLFEAGTGRTASSRAMVRAGLAPRGSTLPPGAVAPLPRFAAPPASQQVEVGMAGCGTTLMFPFVTNQAGFTTGVVITHGTRQAPSGESSAQAGSCDLHYYGATAEGEEVLLIQHSTTIDPGDQLVFTLSGGNPGRNIIGTNQFQGYLMAVCGNPRAGGYAFISDGFGGIADLAMGYLAPVIPVGPDGKRLVSPESPQ